MILVDTDVLIEIFDKNSEKGDEALKKIEEIGEDVIITSLNLHELLYGLHKYAGKEKIDKVMLLDAIEFKKDDASLSAKLEIKSERKGKKVARFDAMIAAIALNRKFRLFTFNKKHFEGIDGLELV
ncbi:MAG: type II toxin-antitoxin system VapC family toxin [Candidatus Hydrothermarchaeota archaeon]|nr:type II toxin-antitoxin system VapC family toxin [Candidatus Hydrothermarchaeota archaeon]